MCDCNAYKVQAEIDRAYRDLNSSSSLKIQVRKLDERVKLPIKKREGDIGYDVYSNDRVYVHPAETVIIPTGLAMRAPEGFYLEVAPRSGETVKRGLVCHGYIERDYTGEIGIIYFNKTGKHIEVDKHTRVARIILRKQYEADLEIVEKLPETNRGSDGYGSSGNK